MSTSTEAASHPAQPASDISKRVLRLLKAQVEDWYDQCRRLPEWEDEHLLEEPGPELLAQHARMLDELERVGNWLGRLTASGGFPDQATANLVAMTLRDLKDARALWHGAMTKERRGEILRTVFNEH